jgi:hypothetical protein
MLYKEIIAVCSEIHAKGTQLLALMIMVSVSSL